MRKPTIHDVAARAGVSKSTVSLVLNHSPLVKTDKRGAVHKAMAELGYVYNAAAAGLRGKVMAAEGQAGGQDVAFVPISADLSDLSVAAFLAALQAAAARKGLGLQILPQGTPWAGRRISTLPHDRADEHTLTAVHPSAAARTREGLAAAMAVRHLLGFGANQVAFVGGDIAQPMDALRIRGYLQRVAKANLTALHLSGGDDYAFGTRAVATILSDYPACTAALCSNDQVALGMQDALSKRRIKTGDEFRLIGWGNTAVAQNSHMSSIAPAWDRLALSCLNWVMDGSDQPFEVTPQLVRRASSLGGA